MTFNYLIIICNLTNVNSFDDNEKAVESLLSITRLNPFKEHKN